MRTSRPKCQCPYFFGLSNKITISAWWQDHPSWQQAKRGYGGLGFSWYKLQPPNHTKQAQR